MLLDFKSRDDLVYGSTKRYEGTVSTAFRQHGAESHCRFVHGYALTFCATFETEVLNENNWVVDFGSLKTFKRWLETMFDHTTLVAEDDPHISFFSEGERLGVFDLRLVPKSGCEAIARLVFEELERWLVENDQSPRVRVMMVEVSEHNANSAYVRRKQER